jgi:hypothetical protein
VSYDFRLVFSSCFLLANMIYGNHIIDSLVKNLNVGLGYRHRIEYSSLMIIKEVEDISSDNRMTFRQLYYYSYFIFNQHTSFIRRSLKHLAVIKLENH